MKKKDRRNFEATAYERKRELAREIQFKKSLAGRSLNVSLRVADPKRRRRASRDFRFFCEVYFPLIFSLPWSLDHLKVLAKTERAIVQGGLFAMAMPRGSGKTSIAEVAAIFSVINGYHEFTLIIGASAVHAEEMLNSIKSELEINDLLAADYPEICLPIQELEGQTGRCAGQLYNNERTRIVWTKTEIVLPTVRPVGWRSNSDCAAFLHNNGLSAGSSAIIKTIGITGRFRGMKFKRPDGRPVRPSLVIVDDPQTDESAHSLSQRASRLRLLAGAVLGLAGPRRKISGIMPCTVIAPGDNADVITDMDKHPEWSGERMKTLYNPPLDSHLWEVYNGVRIESLRRYGDIRLATAFYRVHREAMDAGAVVAWEHRFNPDELSAVQHAMDLKLQDERAFASEYQNDPLPLKETEDVGMLTADQITMKLNGYARGEAPLGANRLTAFVDVQGRLLFWMVCGWGDDFTGYVLDYGAYPEQHRAYFSLRDAQYTLEGVAKGAGLEGAIYAGLTAIVTDLVVKEWKCVDGSILHLSQCLIDANWGASTDVVKTFCRQSSYSAILVPSHGRYVGASSRPFSEYTKKPGDRVGLNWRIPAARGPGLVRHVNFDVNYWKSSIHARIATAMGDPGCLSFFGREPEVHRLLAEHLTSEFRVKTEGRGRIVDEWSLRPGLSENHWFDCLVGCAVGASMQGAVLSGTVVPLKPRRVIRLSDLQKKRRIL